MQDCGKFEARQISNEAVFSLAREMFSIGNSIKFLVSGNSMYPFIRHNTDMVTVASATLEQVKPLDIVLVCTEDEQRYILHRLIKKTSDDFYMVGDAYSSLEGPLPAKAIIGKVTEVHRFNKRSGTFLQKFGFFYRFLIYIWRFVLPLRPLIIRTYAVFRRKSG